MRQPASDSSTMLASTRTSPSSVNFTAFYHQVDQYLPQTRWISIAISGTFGQTVKPKASLATA